MFLYKKKNKYKLNFKRLYYFSIFGFRSNIKQKYNKYLYFLLKLRYKLYRVVLYKYYQLTKNERYFLFYLFSFNICFCLLLLPYLKLKKLLKYYLFYISSVFSNYRFCLMIILGSSFLLIKKLIKMKYFINFFINSFYSILFLKKNSFKFLKIKLNKYLIKSLNFEFNKEQRFCLLFDNFFVFYRLLLLRFFFYKKVYFYYNEIVLHTNLYLFYIKFLKVIQYINSRKKNYLLNYHDRYKIKKYIRLHKSKRIIRFYTIPYQQKNNLNNHWYNLYIESLINKIEVVVKEFQNYSHFLLIVFGFFYVKGRFYLLKKNLSNLNKLNLFLLNRSDVKLLNMKELPGIFKFIIDEFNYRLNLRIKLEEELYNIKKIFMQRNFIISRKLREKTIVDNISIIDSYFKTSRLFNLKKARKFLKQKVYGKYSRRSGMRQLINITLIKWSVKRRLKRYMILFKKFTPFKYGKLYFKFVFNNLFITLTGYDPSNIANFFNVIYKISAGLCEFKGASKSTVYTKQIVIQRALNKIYDLNYKILDLKFKMRPRFWFYDSFLRLLTEKRFYIRFLFYKASRIHGYIRLKKKRYL